MTTLSIPTQQRHELDSRQEQAGTGALIAVAVQAEESASTTEHAFPKLPVMNPRGWFGYVAAAMFHLLPLSTLPSAGQHIKAKHAPMVKASTIFDLRALSSLFTQFTRERARGLHLHPQSR